MLTQVGKYLIEEKVGVGGFGTVYKGRDPFIKRAVAIKTCQSEEEEIKKRFFREAEFAGNLHHRNITTIYDFGLTDDGTPYIVQEFLTGEDLDKLVKKKTSMPLKRKLEILVDVCEGLGYAHAAGIIHRDIKPSNVRILDDGTVKLMDFGIAKSMVSQSTLTQTGITLGTASYLAPEQIRGEDLDARTDIFSLGVLAYELVTGAKPFTGDHISTVLYKIMNEQPAAPSTLVPGVPRALDAIVVKCLEKDRTRRYTSCAELKADCLAVLGALPEGATPETQPAEDMERTVATPSTGYSTGVSARPSAHIRDTPLSPPSNLTARGGVADVKLRTGSVSPEPPPPAPAPASESGPALRVFLSAAVVVLAGLGGFWYYLEKEKKAPQPAPTPAASTASPAPASTAPSTAEAPPGTAATAATAATSAPAPATAAVPPPEPTAPPKPAGPVTVTFRSNQLGVLTVDGVRRGSILPAGVRIALKPGPHKAVFEVPGYMSITKDFVVDSEDPAPVRAEFPPKGLVKITVTPAGADVKIDGVLEAKSTGGEMKKLLRSGAHEIVASMPGYVTASRTVELEEEDAQVVRIDLKKE